MTQDAAQWGRRAVWAFGAWMAFLAAAAAPAQAQTLEPPRADERLQAAAPPDIRFVRFSSPNLASPGTLLSIQSKLSRPRPGA